MGQNKPITPKTYITTLTIIYYGLCLSPVLFGLFLFYSSNDPGFNAYDSEEPLWAAVVLMFLGALVLNGFIFKILLKGVSANKSLKDKLTTYQTASLMRYALLEGPALFAVIVFSFTNNVFYLVLGAILIAYLFLLRPSINKIVADLNLSSPERAIMQRENQKIE